MTHSLTPREILDRLVAFPTVSRDTNAPLILWVQEYLASHGIAAETAEKPGDPEKLCLVAHVGPEIEGGLVLSGHTDVVPVDGQNWHSDPFTVTERDGRLYGRGTTDMKGFDALAIWALVAAKQRGVTRPLQIALSYDEEVGCTGGPDVVAALEKLPKASDVIVGEPTMLQAVTGHKGGVSFRIHVHGYEIHSSIMHRGVSAIMWGAKLIDWANQLNDAQMTQAPSDMAALFDPPFSNAHIGQIQGGTAHNITAKDCQFSLGFRVVPGETLDQWRRALHAKVQELTEMMRAVRPEAWIEAEEAFALPPFAPTENNGAEALVRQITGDNARGFVSYGTEASHFQTGGYSAVVCGPGDIGVAHQPNEYITLAQFNKGQQFMERLLERLA